ncbi:response regulator [Sagittula sp. SSi028]|uniref:response regulator n=1 Tax=Sagittula sp. SSi028 TaxID=3400636 RepID=UPI003AF59423
MKDCPFRRRLPNLATTYMSNKSQFALSLFALTAFVVVIAMSIFVRQNITILEAGTQDQSQWRASQLDSEFLKFSSALVENVYSETPDLDAVRERFDIFYSRIPLIDRATLDAERIALLDGLLAQMDALIPVVDGPDAKLAAELPSILEAIKTQEIGVRTVVLRSIQHISEVNGDGRAKLSALMETMLAAIGLMTLFLIATIIFLIRRTASLHNASVFANEKQRQLTAILHGSIDAIVASDRHGRIIEFNKAAENMFGHKAESVLGRPGTEILATQSARAILNASRDAYLRSGYRTFEDGETRELDLLYADGTIFPAQFSVSVSQTRDGPIFINYIRDLTLEKRHEAEIMQARDTALSSAKERSRFFAMMSHEMRTPLNGVLSSLYLLEEGPLTDAQRANVKTALFSGDILMAHINDVLAIERSESEQEFSKSSCDVSSLTENMIGMMDTMAQNCDVQLDQQQKGLEGKTFSLAQRAVQQVLINLLSNAIKFSPQGAVSLFTQYIPDARSTQSRGTLRFEVSDTGIGISEEDQARIFDDFVSLDRSYERLTGGTGLGLGIVKRFVTQMNGQIYCESTLGEGTSFIVDIPVTEVSDAAIADLDAHAQPVDTTAQKRILIVDDNSVNRNLLEKMLEGQHRVVTASGGQEAVDIAGTKAFDLIFMDISMPEVSGTQACRMIRASGGPNSDTPIIAFTAHALPKDRQAFTDAGMSGFLLKPVNRKALQECVHKAYDPISTPEPAPVPQNDSVTSDLDREHVSDLVDLLSIAQLQDQFEEFRREFRKLMRKLDSALVGGDIKSVQATSHSLAGMCGMMAAARLRMIFKDVEAMAEAGSIAQAHSLMDQVPAILEATEQAWKTILLKGAAVHADA